MFTVAGRASKPQDAGSQHCIFSRPKRRGRMRLSGSTGFVGGRPLEYERGSAKGILRKNEGQMELSIDWVYPTHKGNLPLTSRDGVNFNGSYTYNYQGERISGRASLKMYKNKEGLLLMGLAHDNDGRDFTWWFELKTR